MFLAGCKQSKPATPHLRALPPTQLERQWLAHWKLQPASPVVSTPGALRRAVDQETRRPGVQLVSLVTYRAPTPAPALTIAVSEPASFVRHELKGILLTLRDTYPYVRVVDGHGASVVEFYTTETGGASFVRPDLLGCSPIVRRGPPWRVPPCPVH